MFRGESLPIDMGMDGQAWGHVDLIKVTRPHGLDL
jgi:hypothetical protein